jgi:myo-inositol 2-dehydrogenase/D-chiro-inositol 1-dehydrogenase/scyllo-inositol 2-dehydrogenase (NAD+)
MPRENILTTTRFCLIGTGRAGLIHARNIACRMPNTRLVSVCDANPKTLAEVGREFGVSKQYADYRQAVADPEVDAVVIVTPTFLHCQIACAAAEHGKHVFLEKPMAVTVTECEAINRAVERAGVRLQIGFMRRFDEGFLEAKEILDSGEMGRVMKIKSTGRGPGLPSPWMYDLAKSNGIIAEVNSHDLDSLRWFTGTEASRVYAEAANFKCSDARETHPEFYDNVLANFRFSDGTLGEVDGTCPCHYGYDARVEILCEKGLLLIGHVANQGATKLNVEGRVIGRAVKSWRNLFKDAYLAEMEHFVACVQEGKTPRVTGHDGLRAVAMVVAVNQSLRTAGPVTVPGDSVS